MIIINNMTGGTGNVNNELKNVNVSEMKVDRGILYNNVYPLAMAQPHNY